MSFKSAILISTVLFCSQIFALESDDSVRNGKFLGITGYLSGSTDFHVVPFWKQWNALLQINIEKNKHKQNGIYVVPASPLYYPTYDGYGFYVPHNFGGLGTGNGFQAGYRPMPLFLDDYKTMTTTMAPVSSDLDDKPKLIADSNQSKLSDKNVSVLNDDRKTHKRDIEHKNKTEDEVVATVVEIIITEPSETTTNPTTTEFVTDSTTTTTESTNTNATETIETTTQTVPETTSSTTESTSAQISVIDNGFQPILDFYYGGTPNENANFIYLTTSKPDLSPTDSPNTSNDRSDSSIFKPSIQYEYRNYRYDTDSHFVPIVGTKQIF